MASNSADGAALFEHQKTQFIKSLGTVAEQMRRCAEVAESFSQFISFAQYTPNGQTVFAVDPATIKSKKRKGKDDDGTGKARKIAKPKDPLAPKRPASTYILFQNDIRGQLKEKYPDIPYSELMTRVSQLWGELPAEKKEEYDQRHAVAKAAYEEKKTHYLATHTGAPAGVLPVATPSSPAATTPAVGGSSEAESDSPVSPKPGKSKVVDDASDNEKDSSSDVEDSEEEEEPGPPAKKTKTKSVAPPSKVGKASKVATPIKEKKLTKK